MLDVATENVDTVIFIGGHVKREKAWNQNTTYIYINPELSSEDIYNNDSIMEEAKVNVHLIKMKF